MYEFMINALPDFINKLLVKIRVGEICILNNIISNMVFTILKINNLI